MLTLVLSNSTIESTEYCNLAEAQDKGSKIAFINDKVP